MLGNDNTEACLDRLLGVFEARTCKQATAEWFLDWMLCGTSSSIARLVTAVAPLIHPDLEIYNAFEIVLKYAGYSELLKKKTTAQDNKQEESIQSFDNDNKESILGDNAVDGSKTQAQNWINDLLHPDLDTNTKFKEELETMDDEVIFWMISILKWKSYDAVAKTAMLQHVKFLKELLKEPKNDHFVASQNRNFSWRLSLATLK